MLCRDDLHNLKSFITNLKHYFIAERKYISIILKYNSDLLQNSFNCKIIFILIKFFKFTIELVKNLGIFFDLDEGNEFLTYHELQMFLKLIMIQFKSASKDLRDWVTPGNFKSLYNNLFNCYFKIYEHIIKVSTINFNLLGRYRIL